MRSSLAARAALWAVLVFLYAPVVVLVLYSFNDARFSVGWEGFTLDWYRRLLDSDETAAAVRSTLVVSLSATAVATVLGTLLALGLHLRSFRGRGLVDLLLYLPIVAPDIVIGVALLGFYVAVNFPLDHPGIVAGALIALALSVDDFVVAYFTAGAGASTLPIRIYSMVKRGVTPDINALSTLLLLGTLALILGAMRLQRRDGGDGR